MDKDCRGSSARDLKTWAFHFTWNTNVPAVAAGLTQLEKFYAANQVVLAADPGQFRVTGPFFSYMRSDTTPAGCRALQQVRGYGYPGHCFRSAGASRENGVHPR